MLHLYIWDLINAKVYILGVVSTILRRFSRSSSYINVICQYLSNETNSRFVAITFWSYKQNIFGNWKKVGIYS